MITIERIAYAALYADPLLLRAYVMKFLDEIKDLHRVPRPNIDDPLVMAVAAGLLELFCLRAGQTPPAWTRAVGSAPQPTFLWKDAKGFTRQLCLTESPEPLKKRQLYAAPNFLTFA